MLAYGETGSGLGGGAGAADPDPDRAGVPDSGLSNLIISDIGLGTVARFIG